MHNMSQAHQVPSSYSQGAWCNEERRCHKDLAHRHSPFHPNGSQSTLLLQTFPMPSPGSQLGASRHSRNTHQRRVGRGLGEAVCITLHCPLPAERLKGSEGNRHPVLAKANRIPVSKAVIRGVPMGFSKLIHLKLKHGETCLQEVKALPPLPPAFFFFFSFFCLFCLHSK